MRSRRSPRPPSWLERVEQATAAFTGSARVVADDEVPASETSFRGDGYRVTVEVDPDRPVFGDPPEGSLTVRVETPLAAADREPPGAERFPPDLLREVPYADQAGARTEQPVLVLMTDPPELRALTGPDDGLPGAVEMVRQWLDAGASPAKVLDSLAGAASPVAVVAGFELALRGTEDVADLTVELLRLDGRPPGAAGGIMSVLRRHSAQLSGQQVAHLARRLLDLLEQEDEPAAVVAMLSWLDAEHERIVAGDGDLAEPVEQAARRASERTFDGPAGDTWTQEVARHAEALADRR